MRSIGYLGPPGTFTQEALEANLSEEFDTHIPYGTVPEVLLAVEAGEVDSGIVPIENSIEGSVNVTLDTLAFETQLYIEREVVHQIRHRLVAKPGVTEEKIEEIVSHPHATAQCRRFLARNFPGIPLVAANSTAEAALTVSGMDESVAAVTTEIAASLYGLVVLQRDIEDYPSNRTRFIVVGKERPPPTGADKTSMACFIRENRPGSLLEILTEFASRDVNLTKIESRPTKKVLGEYYFFIDIDGHVEDDAIKDALGSLMGKLREIKLLGSYPAAQPLE
jgi:prephenate dehydratase